MEVAFRTFLKSDRIYTPEETEEVLTLVRPYCDLVRTKATSYINIPASFDIETTSFFRTTGNGQPEKCAIMYEWTLGLYGLVIVGRTWDEFLRTLTATVTGLGISQAKRLCVYVHNLAFEFQFLRKWMRWLKVFSIDNRKPIYAVTDAGIEFRCSYLLSGYSLEKIGHDLRDYKVQKLVGNLDYDKMRHAKTTLTPDEIAYCANDVKVVMAYIAEQIGQNGDISKIPMTKTGYVRTYCRNSCFFEPGGSRKKSYKRTRYMDVMRALRLEPDEYKQLKRAFQGGFTHANPFYSGKIVADVTSYDFTSSYPAVMVAEQFPMSQAEKVEIRSREQFEKNLKLYCCLFDVEFVGLQSQLWHDSYISVSRCWGVRGAILNNGRIVSADHLYTTVTDQDFLIIRNFYTWDHIKIGAFRRYKRGYLPTDFVKAILKLYRDKTTLKGVEGAEVDYMRSKEMLNSCYGMTVTDIVRPEIVYGGDAWLPPETPDYDTAISAYNRNDGRFLFYPWGVWVTAYARRNLFTGILEFGSDYVYSDTDSVKVRNAQRHIAYIEEYNRKIREQLCRAMNYHGMSPAEIEPETKEGVKKCLGVWDFDGHYARFKTLGAKRYLVEYSEDERNKRGDRGKLSLTVSGLNKQTCVPYLCRGWRYDMRSKQESNSPFEKFCDSLYIPPAYTGKMTHTYIDSERVGTLIDYKGVAGDYRELSGVHLEKADYSLSISREYAEYILGLEWGEISG